MRSFKYTLFLLVSLYGCGQKNNSAPIAASPNPDDVLIYGSPPIARTGSDPLIPYFWHLINEGNYPLSSNHGLSSSNSAETDLNLLSSVTQTGAGVTVLISDDTVEHFHDDLYDNWSLADSFNFLNDDYRGNPAAGLRGDDSHGTSVAGIIGAVKNNATGGYGIAHDATLAGANILSQAVTQTNAVFLTQINADVDIINMSWGTSQDKYYDVFSGYEAQVLSASQSRRSGLGSIMIKSAGNDFYISKNGQTRFGNSNFDGDNTLSPIINVAAITARGFATDYSSPGSNIWVSAPGGEDGISDPAILTTDRLGCNYGYAKSTSSGSFNQGTHPTISNADCKYTSRFNGTSAAAPMLSGAVALLLQKSPGLNWREVKYLLAKTAHKIHSGITDIGQPSDLDITVNDIPSSLKWEYAWKTNNAGFNFHNWYGFGSVDIFALLNNSLVIPVGLSSSIQSTVNIADSSDKIITDNSAVATTYNLITASNITVEDIILTIDMNHANLEEVMIEVESPTGMKNIVLNAYSALNGETNMSAQRFRSNAFYGELAAGTWKVKFFDVKNNATGTVTNLNLEIRGY